MNVGRYIPPDASAFFERLHGLSQLCSSKQWRVELRACCDENWSYEGMVARLRWVLFDGVPNPDGLQPYFQFLMALKNILLKTLPHSNKGIELLQFCELLATAPYHDIQVLFGTTPLEAVLASSAPWRKRFFEAWVDHPNKDVRSLLAFATCFTEFSDKKDLLLRLANDPELEVRRSAVQSLWYREHAYPPNERQEVAKILETACRTGDDELLAKFGSDILQKNFSLH